MIEPTFALLEVVKLKNPRRRELAGIPGEITPDSLGTIVEMGQARCVAKTCSAAPYVSADWIYWVEFINDDGKTVAIVPVKAKDLEKA